MVTMNEQNTLPEKTNLKKTKNGMFSSAYVAICFALCVGSPFHSPGANVKMDIFGIATFLNISAAKTIINTKTTLALVSGTFPPDGRADAKCARKKKTQQRLLFPAYTYE